MTPSLLKSYENYRGRVIRSSKAQYKKLKLSIDGKKPLTEKQVNRYNSLKRSKEWREADPKNQATYEKYMQIRNERTKERRKKEKAEKLTNSKIPENNKLGKRGLDPSIDLNAPHPEYEQFYSTEESVQPQSQVTKSTDDRPTYKEKRVEIVSTSNNFLLYRVS